MVENIKQLLSRPYWVIALMAGAVMVVLPCLAISKGKDDWSFHTNTPTTYWLILPGIALLTVSALSFIYVLFANRGVDPVEANHDASRSQVKEEKGRFWAAVGACEVSVVTGRIEDFPRTENIVIVLPCNEYFDHCVTHPNSALGAFAMRVFDGQIAEFQTLITEECRRQFGPGAEQEKSQGQRALSYGPGRCLLLRKPLNRSMAVALVSTSVQRVGTGMYSRVSHLFDGIRDLTARMGDARISEIALPVLGGGHGGLSPRLAFVGTLLAVAEAARHGGQGHRLSKATVVVFRQDLRARTEISDLTIRRTLALIADSV